MKQWMWKFCERSLKCYRHVNVMVIIKGQPKEVVFPKELQLQAGFRRQIINSDYLAQQFNFLFP